MFFWTFIYSRRQSSLYTNKYVEKKGKLNSLFDCIETLVLFHFVKLEKGHFRLIKMFCTFWVCKRYCKKQNKFLNSVVHRHTLENEILLRALDLIIAFKEKRFEMLNEGVSWENKLKKLAVSVKMRTNEQCYKTS